MGDKSGRGGGEEEAEGLYPEGEYQREKKIVSERRDKTYIEYIYILPKMYKRWYIRTANGNQSFLFLNASSELAQACKMYSE